MSEAILVSLRQVWADLATAAVSLGPRLVVALVLVTLGWLVARAIGWGTGRIVAWLPVDRLAERTRFADALRLAELPPAGRVCASAVFWLVWLAFLAEAVDIVRLPGFENVRAEFVWFVARLVRAVLILVVGVVTSNVAWRATLVAAFNAGWPSARLMAAALRVLVLAVAVLTALAHLGIPLVIVLTAFSIAFAALMLGLALAFGLGGRDAARELIARHVEAARSAKNGGQPHL